MANFTHRGTGAVKARAPRVETRVRSAASSGEFEGYLAEIASQLHVDPARERDILAEVRSHLEEATTELRASGLGEEESLAEAMDRFGASREVGRMLNRLHGDSLWIKVGLAILPGLFALASGGGLLSALLGARTGQALSHPGLIGVCLLVVAVGLVRERRLAVWSYPALGVLVFGLWFWTPWPWGGQSNPFWQVAPPLIMLAVLAAIGASAVYLVYRAGRIVIPPVVWALLGLMILTAMAYPACTAGIYGHVDRGSAILAVLPVSVWWMGILLSPVVIGLPLARRSGVVAGLMVVAAQYVLVEEIFDPTYPIFIWTSDYAAVRVLSSMPALAFLIVPPVCVLLCRQPQVRFWGLVLPPLLGLLSIAVIRAGVLQASAVEYGANSWLMDGLAAAQLAALFALTGLIYHRLGPRGTVRAESFNSTASGSMSLGCLADERRA